MVLFLCPRLEFLPLVLRVYREALVMASLGIITGILKFGDSATALMLTIFALQDSLGQPVMQQAMVPLTLILPDMPDTTISENRNCNKKFKIPSYLSFSLRYDGLHILTDESPYLHLSYALQSYTYR